MSAVTIANVEMAAAWDGDEGRYWAANAPAYEATAPWVSARLGLRTMLTPTDRVLDIGCGTGKTTFEAARLVSAGSALGVDLSSQMLAYARERARTEGVANVDFLQADAQVHPFDEAAFDAAISAFGAMFFNDPIAAFSNLHRAMRPSGRLAMLAWRRLEENEWLTAIRGALAMGRDLPAPPAGAPGPFGLANPERVREVLDAAGFTGVDVTAVDEPVSLGATADDAWALVRGMGIVRGLTQDLDADSQREALDRLRAVVAERETPDGVLLESAAWLITAHRP
jgi:SAM-dependent methyltransferase